MKIWRFLRSAAVAGTFCFPFFLFCAHSQDRPPVPPSSPSSHPSDDEKLLFDATNRTRVAAGMQPLRWDGALAAAAGEHAALMAQEILLSHRYPGEPSMAERAARAGAKFSMIAENVAMGFTADSIYEAWMHSPGHRKNILNPELTAIGIATIRGAGRLFAVQDFSIQLEDLSLQQQEARVILLLKEAGLRKAMATDDARKTCGMDRGYVGPPVSYVFQFEITDLSKLPDELLRSIKSRGYQTAAVGACGGGDEAGFTRYRLAVLLH